MNTYRMELPLTKTHYFAPAAVNTNALRDF